MAPAAVPPPGWGPDATDQRLIGAMALSLPLVERPFDALGARLGLSEEAVIDHLHRLLAQGVLSHFGPLFSADAGNGGPAFAALQVPAAEFARDLVAATRSGLPLLARPYEAVGAMVGATGAQVRTALAQMLQQGLVLRIGVVLRGDEAARCD